MLPEDLQPVETYKPSFVFFKEFKLPQVALVVVFLLFIFYVSFLAAPRNFPLGKIYNLKSGQTLSLVSNNFKQGNIIRSNFFFKSFVFIFSFGKFTLIEGNYGLYKKANVMKMAWRVSHGELDIVPLKITIPEGIASFEITDIISAKFPGFDKKIFQKIVNDRKLEGYLFPDTYFFSPDMTEEQIIKIMTDNYKERIQEVSQVLEKFGKSESDVIKMASILEEEGRTMETRQMIAGILWKRISIKMALQVDSSFKYINGKTTATITHDDLKIDSPHNSYLYRGLPPTPISNPGLEAIKAATTPIKTAYFYFLTDKEGNMHYAVTFEEHVANKLKYLR